MEIQLGLGWRAGRATTSPGQKKWWKNLTKPHFQEFSQQYLEEGRKGISTDNFGSWEGLGLDIGQFLSLVVVELLEGVSYLVGFEALFELICWFLVQIKKNNPQKTPQPHKLIGKYHNEASFANQYIWISW